VQAATADLTLRPPYAGIVHGLSLMIGQSVGTSTPVAMIASRHWLQVNLELPQTAIPQLAVGQPLTVASNGVIAGGQLTDIGAAPARVQNNISYIPVTGQVQWEAGLAPGMDVVVETGPISTIGGISTPVDSADATLQYLNRAAIVPGVSGTVSALDVADHAQVGADQAVLLLSNQTLQDAIMKAQAVVVQAQQQVADDKAAVADAQTALALANAGAENATVQHVASLAAAESQLQTQEANLAADEGSVADLTVRAPIGGRIASIAATPGAQVGAQGSLFTVVAPGNLNLVLQVPQSNIDQIGLGEAATVTSDAVPGQSFTALVSAESPVGVDTNGITNFNVTLSVEEGRGLLPGMAADATITLKSVHSALLVPLEAVHGIGIGSGTVALPPNGGKAGKSARAAQPVGGAWVAVLQNGGTFAKVPVRLGINNGLDVQVLSGLSAGEQIVTSDLAELTAQTKLSLLGRIFHRAPQRTAGVPSKPGVGKKNQTPARRARPTAKGKVTGKA
jgi:RND family efflux transporter MFP subunit